MTQADTYWTNRLEGKVPDNFLNNTVPMIAPDKNPVTDLVNKVGLINIIRAPTVDNPFLRYVGTTMPFGKYVENIAIGQVTAEKFSPNDCTRDFRKVGIDTWYAELNDSYEYNVSVSRVELNKGVHDAIGLSNVAEGLVDSARAWANNDMVVKFAKQFARISTSSTDTVGYTGGYETIAISEGGNPLTDEQIAKNLLLKIIYYIDEFKGLRTQYNKLGNPMVANGPFGIDVLVTRHMRTYIRQALADIYHISEFDIPANIVEVDSFPTPAGNIGEIGALIIDPRVLLYHEEWMNMEQDRCTRGRYDNYSLAGEGTFNFLWGYNAIALMLNTDAKEYTPTPFNMPTGA